jgi:hypothetical protein
MTSPTPSTTIDPDVTLSSIVAAASPDERYADPTPAEREVGGVGLAHLAIGDVTGAAGLLEPLGFTVTAGVDAATGRRLAMAVSETGDTTKRRWGVYLIDLSAPLGLCVAVPHPRFDEGCELLALRLWRAVPGSMLAMASVHRNAAGGHADHARNSESMFHRLWAGFLGPRGVPQVQIHGFANSTAPEEVAVSVGVGPLTAAAVRIADEIAATGLITTRIWDGTADIDLRATRNVQGIAAEAGGWVWVHIEHRKSVRDDEAKWHPAIDAVAAANPTQLA